MPEIVRVRTLWTGFSGAPGYTNMYFIGPTTNTLPDPSNTAGLVHHFFTQCLPYLPGDVDLTVQAEQAIIDSATGKQTGAQLGPTTGPMTGADNSPYSAASGICVPWSGDAYLNGRLMRGRTFLVPAGGQAYQTDGSIATVALSTIQGAMTELTSDPNDHLVVWHRPTKADPESGTISTAGPGTIKDQAAVLRSRRS